MCSLYISVKYVYIYLLSFVIYPFTFHEINSEYGQNIKNKILFHHCIAFRLREKSKS
jgi:hypothetical protein